MNKKNYSVDLSIGPLTHEDSRLIYKLNDLSNAFGGMTVVRPSHNEDEVYIRVSELDYLINRLEFVAMEYQDGSSEGVIPSPF